MGGLCHRFGEVMVHNVLIWKWESYATDLVRLWSMMSSYGNAYINIQLLRKKTKGLDLGEGRG